MAEVESFKEKHIGGLPKHTLTTKGTESYNFIQAVISIIREEASYKEVSHPEWANKEPIITLG